MKILPLLLTCLIWSINCGIMPLQASGLPNDSIVICGRTAMISGAPSIFLVEDYQAAVPLTQKERSLPIRLIADSFYVSVPVKNRINYIRFRNLKPFRSINNYLLSAGDSVHIDGVTNAVLTTSIEPVKLLECQLKLDSINALDPIAGRDTVTYSKRLLRRAELNFERGKHLIREYRGDIGDNLLDVLEINFFLRTHSIFYAVWKSDGLADSNKFDPVRVLAKLAHDVNLEVDETVWLLSDKYIEYRAFVLMGYFELLSKRGKLTNSPYKEAYEYVQKNFDDLLKDRITSYLLIKSIQRDPHIVPQLPKVINSLSDSLAKHTLLNAYKSVKPGEKAFSFNLSDDKGRRHCLSDYKGKVVIMKFWFTGCLGCAEIKENMGIVKQAYKEDKEVLFLNVNMSKKRDVWLSGLASGKYTGKDEINLFTDGEGIEHPLVKHYQFASAPQLLIIDKRGNVFSANPPLPYTEEQTEELIKFINDARKKERN